MSKNRILIGIILSIFLLIFNINGSTAYYKYTQESGADFYVGIADKSDALEDTNEIRRIVDDLGNLLVHSKRNDLYPKDGSAGGTLAIPNSALVSFATGTKGDLFYCSSTNVWVKLNIGSDNQILVVATDLPNWETASSNLLSDVAFIAMLDEAETITANWVNTAFPWADNEVADNITCSNYYLKTEIDTLGEVETIYAANIIDNTELAAALGAYYLKTAIDTIGEVETIWGKNITDSDELASALALYYLKTAIDTQEKMEAIWGVSLANDSELHTILTLGTANGLSLDGQELSLAFNSDTSAGAVASGAGQVNQVWKTNASGVPDWREDDTTALTTFLALTDVPASYTGHGGKIVRVAGAEDVLEFIAMPGGGDVLGPATSVDHSVARFNGTDNKTIQDSLMTINDDGSVNIPLGETYKINTVPLAYGNIVGAAGSGANTNITSLTGLTTPLGIVYGGTGSVSASGARTALGLVYGVNVQAYDAGLLSLAGLTYASPSFIKVTANDTYAIRTIAETLSDLGIDLSLYYLKTAIDSQGEVENIWGVSLANDSELYTNLTSFVDQTAWRLFYSDGDGDVVELPLGADGTYLKSNGATSAPTFETGSDKTNWVIPQDYATGSGTEGDPWANNCINTAYTNCPTGGTIFMMRGYYTLGTALTIAKQINIIGEGMNKTFIVMGDIEGMVVTGASADYVTIKDLTIDCDAQELDNSSRNGLIFSGVDHAVVENVEVKDAGYSGIDNFETNYSLFKNIWVHGCFRNGMHPGSNTAGRNMYNQYRDIYGYDNGFMAFADRGCDEGDAVIENCYNIFDNIHAWDNSYKGIYIGGQKAGTISNCYVSGNAISGLQLGTATVGIEDFTISNCYIDRSSYQGISLQNSKNVNFTNVIVKNNNSSKSTYSGILINNSDDIKFNSCQIYDERVVAGDTIAFIDGDAGTDSITDSTERFLAEGFLAGKDITVTGDSDNNGVYTIVSVTAGTITLATGSLPAAPEAAGDDVTITHEAVQTYAMDLDGTNSGISLVNCKLSPNATGEIDGTTNNVIAILPVISLQTSTGDGTTTIDWQIGIKYQFTFGAQSDTFTFVAPIIPCNLLLEIVQDGTGGRDLTLPASVKWLGTEPTWTDGGAGKTIVVSMWYNGTYYWSQASPWET